MEKLHISEGNSKLGQVPSVSLDPETTCKAEWPCWEKCYARKLARFRKNVKTCWENNTEVWERSPHSFERQLITWVERQRPDMFRWTVGGEIPDMRFKNMMFKVAKACPGTKFFVYTRKDHWSWNKKPNNLFVRFSVWLDEGDRMPTKRGSRLAFIAKEKPAVKVFTCNDGCDKCGYCVSPRAKLPVWFKTH